MNMRTRVVATVTLLCAVLVGCDASSPSEPKAGTPEPPAGSTGGAFDVAWVPAEDDATVDGLPDVSISITDDDLIRVDVGAVDFGASATSASLVLVLETDLADGPMRLECSLVRDFGSEEAQPAGTAPCNLFDENYANVLGGPFSTPGRFTANRAEYQESFLLLTLVAEKRVSDDWTVYGQRFHRTQDVHVNDPDLIYAVFDSGDGPGALPISHMFMLASSSNDAGTSALDAYLDAYGAASPETMDKLHSVVADLQPVVALS